MSLKIKTAQETITEDADDLIALTSLVTCNKSDGLFCLQSAGWRIVLGCRQFVVLVYY